MKWLLFFHVFVKLKIFFLFKCTAKQKVIYIEISILQKWESYFLFLILHYVCILTMFLEEFEIDKNHV